MRNLSPDSWMLAKAIVVISLKIFMSRVSDISELIPLSFSFPLSLFHFLFLPPPAFSSRTCPYSFPPLALSRSPFLSLPLPLCPNLLLLAPPSLPRTHLPPPPSARRSDDSRESNSGKRPHFPSLLVPGNNQAVFNEAQPQ